MRAVWVDKDAATQTAKLKALGITRAYYDARSTPQYPTGLERGIYRVQSWDNLGPAAFAKVLSDDCSRWGAVSRSDQLAVHANIELHDAAYLVAFLGAWRAIRQHRETALVIEGLQAGWFSGVLVSKINLDAQLSVLAEAYTGDMGPLDADNVRSNLVNYGVMRQKALVMYDAARLSPFWDGCAFTQQRIL